MLFDHIEVHSTPDRCFVDIRRAGRHVDKGTSSSGWWICGQYKLDTAAGRIWEFQGLFSSRELAVAACRDSAYFIAPVVPDEQYPHKTCKWPGAIYPLCPPVRADN